MTKAERYEMQEARHRRIRYDLDTKIKSNTATLDYNEKLRAAYYLCSMMTLWIKMPKEKATMPALEGYVMRMRLLQNDKQNITRIL